jgi:hypothetical protein
MGRAVGEGDRVLLSLCDGAHGRVPKLKTTCGRQRVSGGHVPRQLVLVGLANPRT